jgi:hypothetical protein
MKKEILVDPIVTHDESSESPFAESSMSEELGKAIQNLIYRLREIGPLIDSD